MRRSEAGVDDSSRRNGSCSGEGTDDDLNFGSGNSTDECNDPTLRKEIRTKYRDLIIEVQQNREDMLSLSNNKLTEVLEEANTLFKNVRHTREAALDAQLLVVATDLGKEKASQLFADDAFDADDYSERLLSFMGINRLESNDEQNADGYLPQDAWQRLAKRAECCFRTAPTFHYMLGSFHAEPPPPRQKIERQRKVANKEEKRNMPTQLKKMEESHQEATEKEVERILGYLRRYHQVDPTKPISYYEFVIDPNSFSRTIENMFHVSFLIRDNYARIYLDDDRLPCIAPINEDVEGAASSGPKQCVTSFCMDSWEELIAALNISKPMIQALDTQSQ